MLDEVGLGNIGSLLVRSVRDHGQSHGQFGIGQSGKVFPGAVSFLVSFGRLGRRQPWQSRDHGQSVAVLAV